MDPNLPYFPLEIQKHIASYLCAQDMAPYRAVNRQWREILSPLCWLTLKKFRNLNFYHDVHFKYLRRLLEYVNDPLNLTFARGDFRTGSEFEELLKLPNLEGLHLVQCFLPDDYPTALARFTNLKKLRFLANRVTKVQANDLLVLSKLTRLQRLEWQHQDEFEGMDEFILAHLTDLQKLQELPVTLDSDSILTLVPRFPNLEDITIKGRIVTDVGIRHLTVLTNLEILSLNQCSSITDSAVKQLSTLVNLKHVVLDSCSALTTDALNGFRSCSKITNFQLIGSPHIDSLSPLINCINMEHLVLNKCYVEPYGLIAVQNFTRLTELNCRDFRQLKDNGLKYCNLTGLKVLNLHGCTNITNEGLKNLSEMTDLQHLELGICERITDDGLQYLDRLIGLTYLGMLSLVRITDRGVEYLTRLTRLEHIDLSSCRVTDATIRLYMNSYLKQPKDLRKKLHRLDIFSCPNITPEGITNRDMITTYDYYMSDNF